MMQATHPRDPGSEDEARKVIEAFFPLFSRRAVRGLLSVVNFPRIRVTGSRTVIHTVCERVDRISHRPLEDDWHHTALDSLTFVQSSPDKVHALVVFSRYQANGQRDVSHPTLWIVTKIDGHWGIQVRSMFAP